MRERTEYPFPCVGEKAYFMKSGVIVSIVESIGDDKWTVEKEDGKRMTATTEGLRALGPYACLCQALHHTSAGSGCEVCST